MKKIINIVNNLNITLVNHNIKSKCSRVSKFMACYFASMVKYIRRFYCNLSLINRAEKSKETLKKENGKRKKERINPQIINHWASLSIIIISSAQLSTPSKNLHLEAEMAAFSSSSSSLISPSFLQNPTKLCKTHLPILHLHPLKPQFAPLKLAHSSNTRRLNAVAESVTADTSSVAERRLYVGNIPRTVTNDELQKIVEEHGAVEKTEVCLFFYL